MIRFSTLMVLTCVTASGLMLGLSASSTLDDLAGRISLAGCRCCNETSSGLITCYFNNTGCSTAGCQVYKFNFAACSKTAANETDDCSMHVDPLAEKWSLHYFTPDNGLTCTDNGNQVFTLPANGDCQSPGYNANFTYRCKLDAVCGATEVPNSAQIFYGRLVCGA